MGKRALPGAIFGFLAIHLFILTVSAQTTNAPSNVVVSDVTATTLAVSWTSAPVAPAEKVICILANGVNTCKSAGTGYRLSAVSTSPTTIAGLAPATAYTCFVRTYSTVTADGSYNCSSGVDVTTLSLTATAVALDEATATTATLSWAPASGANSYRILCVLDNGLSTCTSPGSGSKLSNVLTSPSGLITGLAGASTYQCFVRSYETTTGDQTYKCSDLITVTTIPLTDVIASGVSATAASATSVSVTWTSAPTAQSHKVVCVVDNGLYGCTSAGSGSVIYSDIVADSPAVVSPLKPDTAYLCYVRSYESPTAASAYICSDPAAVTTPALAPTNVVVDTLATTATSGAVSWDAAPGASSYRILCVLDDGTSTCTSPGSGSKLSSGVTATSGTISGLSPGKNYRCHIRGYQAATADGVYACSTSAPLTTLTAVDLAATGVTASPQGATSVSVTWSASATALAHKVVCVVDNGVSGGCTSAGSGSVIYSAIVTISSVTVDQLAPGTAYLCYVRSYETTTGSGTYACSDPGAVTTVSLVPGDVALTGTTTTTATLSWSPAAGAGSYKIVCVIDNGVNTCSNAGSGAKFSAPALGSPATVSGLSPGTAYKCFVRGYESAIGDGANSCSTSVDASTVSLVPGDVAVVSTTITSVTLSYSPTAGALSYKALCVIDNGVNSCSNAGSGAKFSVGTTTSPVTVSGLTPGTAYKCYVRGYDTSTGDGLNMCSTAVDASTVSMAATDVAVTGAAPTTLSFSWTNAPGAASYRVLCVVNNAINTCTSPGSGSKLGPITTSPTTLTGLTAGTEYKCFVRGYADATGSGLYSCAAPIIGSTVALAPTNVAISAPTATSVTLTWTNAPGAASYRTLCVVNNGVNTCTSPGSGAKLSGAATSPAAVTGLVSGTSYKCFIRGYEAANVSGVYSCSAPVVKA